jgi:hypothetical protein
VKMTLKADLLTPQTANYSGHDLLENGLVPPPPDHKRGAINEVPFASGQMAFNRLPERFQRAIRADNLARMHRVVFTSAHGMLSVGSVFSLSCRDKPTTLEL